MRHVRIAGEGAFVALLRPRSHAHGQILNAGFDRAMQHYGVTPLSARVRKPARERPDLGQKRNGKNMARVLSEDAGYSKRHQRILPDGFPPFGGV